MLILFYSFIGLFFLICLYIYLFFFSWQNISPNISTVSFQFRVPECDLINTSTLSITSPEMHVVQSDSHTHTQNLSECLTVFFSL